MKERVTAITSFVAGIGWFIFGIFVMMTKEINDGDGFFAMLVLLTSAVSTVLYVFWTKFGKKEYSEIEKIEFENELLKRQIEQKELKKKLEE